MARKVVWRVLVGYLGVGFLNVLMTTVIGFAKSGPAFILFPLAPNVPWPDRFEMFFYLAVFPVLLRPLDLYLKFGMLRGR